MKFGFLVLASALLLGGCAATALSPGARRVMVTKTQAPPGCVYMGSVVGEQGGSFSGKYTSNKNLAEGAFNDMKNKAHDLGANYVVLENTQAGSTMSGDKNGVSSGQTDVTHIGNAFKCPASELPGATTTTNAPAPTGPGAAGRVVIVGM